MKAFRHTTMLKSEAAWKFDVSSSVCLRLVGPTCTYPERCWGWIINQSQSRSTATDPIWFRLIDNSFATAWLGFKRPLRSSRWSPNSEFIQCLRCFGLRLPVFPRIIIVSRMIQSSRQTRCQSLFLEDQYTWAHCVVCHTSSCKTYTDLVGIESRRQPYTWLQRAFSSIPKTIHRSWADGFLSCI